MWAHADDAGRLAIAATLLVAGASKLASPRPFASAVGEVFGWNRRAGVVLARIVAAVELPAAFMLATGWMTGTALVLTGLVGAGIIVFALAAMRRETTTSCGCFGESSGRPIGVRNLLAGVGLLAGALILWPILSPQTPATTQVAAPVDTAALMLPLTAVTALLAVMVRDRARLIAPFRHHFQPVPTVPTVPIPPHRRSHHG